MTQNEQIQELEKVAAQKFGAGCTIHLRSVEGNQQWWLHDRSKALRGAAPTLDKLAQDLGLTPPETPMPPINDPIPSSTIPADALPATKAAELFGVTAVTIYAWRKRGWIKGYSALRRRENGGLVSTVMVSPTEIREMLKDPSRVIRAFTRKFRHIVRELRGEIPAGTPLAVPEHRTRNDRTPTSQTRQLGVMVDRKVHAEAVELVNQLNQPPYYMTLSLLTENALRTYVATLRSRLKTPPAAKRLMVHPLISGDSK